MTIQRLENVGIVVDDLAAATRFFVELGLKVLGEGPVEGGWVDRVVGLEGVRVDVAMLETPDGHGRLELMKFHAPPARGGDRHAPANTLGIRRVAFAVDDIDAAVAGLQARGAELVGGVSATKTVTGFAMSAARRGSSSCLRSRLAEGSVRQPPPQSPGRPLGSAASRQPADHDSSVCTTRCLRRTRGSPRHRPGSAPGAVCSCPDRVAPAGLRSPSAMRRKARHADNL
jgi:catechol 2,3-dioxygenase-like lactoylglutathione lyase family enzyme